MVADRGAVVADQVHRDRVVERHPFLQAGVELRPRQEVVARRHHDDAALRPDVDAVTRSVDRTGLQVFHHRGKASDPAEILETTPEIDELRFAVVVVQDGEDELGRWVGGNDAGKRIVWYWRGDVVGTSPNHQQRDE